MTWRSSPQSNVAQRVCSWACWAVLIYVVMFWRLGFPSFWDPDEAVYAVASREMLRTGDWLAPMYNGAPFFDKPILFYWLQLLSFKLFGATEFAARLVPAASAVGVVLVTIWAGRVFFNRQVGRDAGVIVAVLPATFALSAYAILDMTFTFFLFAGVALIGSAVLHDKPARQWWGYVALALAVLTKGPLAVALAGVTFLAVLAVVPRLRRPLWRLRWLTGLALIAVIAAPWFIYMYLRFRFAFIDGYFLRENVLLYAANLYTTTRAWGFYFRVAALGFLPFTPLVLGRLVDRLRGDRFSHAEQLFWLWSAAVTLFFTGSRFKLDHYIYPVLPAMSIIAAHTWWRLREAAPLRQQIGAAIGAVSVGVILVAAGVVAWMQLGKLPVDLARTVVLLPIALVVGGAVTLACVAKAVLGRGPGASAPPLTSWPASAAAVASVATMLVTYGVALNVGLNAFEAAKPIKDLAQYVSSTAPTDADVTAYRLERWKTSWRFYADRPMITAESPGELTHVLQRPGLHYMITREDELDDVRAAVPKRKVTVVRERRGLTNTSGRGLRRSRDEWPNYVVVEVGLSGSAAPAVPAAPATPATAMTPGGSPVATPAINVAVVTPNSTPPAAAKRGAPRRLLPFRQPAQRLANLVRNGR